MTGFGKQLLFFVVGLLLLSGCADIRQVIHVNHDGSGKIVEKITVTTRGYRLAKGKAARTKGALAPHGLLSEAAFQQRLKAMGGVTLKPGSRKETTLPDGRKQIVAVYTFKDISKISLWVAPTFSYRKEAVAKYKDNYRGRLGFKFVPEYERFKKIHRETLFIQNPEAKRLDLKSKPMTPTEKRKFVDVLPIYQDMLKDFHLSITLVAPIEEFDEGMARNLPTNGSRVELFKVDGKYLRQSPDFILQLVMNEVRGGNDFMAQERAMSGIFTMFPSRNDGYLLRFMK